MTNKEAINILINVIQLPVTRGSGKSQARYLVFEAIQKAIVALEVADVVRCKDCKHWKDSDGVCPYYHNDDGYYSEFPPDDFFCANGEREEKTDEV